uniref:Uncharacterized protein n=1 Tax=uncultured organism TaxID=155900 RepID=M1QCD6_9ZZZZ|nr:hypothetical protein FLSS-16_0024 [uncultured organism]
MEPVLSQVPVPTGFNLQTQQKIQAVQHWKILASEVAETIRNRMEEKITKLHKSIYVAPSGNTPFEQAFRDLLISQLIKQGLNVTHKNGDHLLLSFEVETFKHHDRLKKTSYGTYMTLVPGMSINRFQDSVGAEKIKGDPRKNMEAGKYIDELPQREVLITTSLMYKGEFLARDSSVFYINDKEWWHYKNRKREEDYKVKSYQVVAD